MIDGKILTCENHLTRDKRMNYWTPAGLGGTPLHQEFWVESILAVSLSANIPKPVIGVFERAKSCMVYGCYYYPLFSLAIEDLFRVLEFGLAEFVINKGGQKTRSKMRYFDMIKWAEDEKYLTSQIADRWRAAKELRNTSSHEPNSFLLGPNSALQQLAVTKEFLERLEWGESCSDESVP